MNVVAKLLPEAVTRLRQAGLPPDDSVLVVSDLRDERFGFNFAVMSSQVDWELSESEARQQVLVSIAEGRTMSDACCRGRSPSPRSREARKTTAARSRA